MEAKINVAEILKDKPQGTKLYDLLRNIEVELDSISHTDYEKNIIWCRYNDVDPYDLYGYSTFGTERGWLNGLQILLPSKEMRNWNKFAWKKGDVLVNRDKNMHLIFEKFTDDTYTIFAGKHCYEKDFRNEYNYERRFDSFMTEYFTLETDDADVQTYIRTIENKLGGKLNLETLEVEKHQPEFFDLKPKCEFKPFDRCIWKIRNCEGSIWRASFVSYVDEYGAIPMGMSINEDLVNLIILPYNDETAKLIGTTNNWEG